MATDIERLVVSLEASTVRYERALQRAMGQTNQTARRIESRFERMNRGLGNSFVSLQRNIAVAFAGVAATRGATQLIDSATRIENSLKVAGLAGEELDRVYQRLYQSARSNAAPLESLVTLYGRAALVQNELGVSTDQLLSFTNNVALALRVSGQSAQEASGALLQLSQALGSGVVRAEEFNSMLEGAPTILQAAAAGIEEAEGSVAKLRQIMLDGNLSSRALFDGFEAGSVILEEKVAGSTLTVSQALENLRTELIDVAKEMNDGTDISAALADGLSDLSGMIRSVGEFANAAVEPIQNFIGLLQSMEATAVGAANALAAITGADRIGAAAATAINDMNIPGLTAGSSRAGGVVQGTFELLGATPQDEALAALLTGESPPATPAQITVTAPPRTISINDEQYSTAGVGGSGSGSSSSGGGSSQADAYQRALEQQRERLRMLEMETELQQTLNPLVNDYGYAVERLRTQMELENAAAEAGLELTPERRAEIEQLADGYATATANAQRLADAQALMQQTFDDLGQAGRSALDSIINGFIEGKSAADILNNVVRDLASNLISIGLNALTGGISGLLGFASGGYTGPGGKYQPKGIVHGGEYVFSKEATQRAGVGNLEAMHRSLRGYANGGFVGMPALPAVGGSNQPIRIALEVQEGSAFETRIIEVSGPVSAEISKRTVQTYDRAMPGTMSNYDARYR